MGIVVSNLISLDGYIEGSGGDLMAMPFDQTFNEHNAEQIRGASRLLYGKKTYLQMLSYWPNQLDNADEHERSIAEKMASGLPITVVSDSLTAEETGAWRDQTTIVGRADAQAAVAALRGQGGDTVIFGSRTLVNDLLANNLVDELRLLVGPKLVAGDQTLFAGTTQTDLKLKDARRLPDSDTVLLTYMIDN